MLTSFSPLAPPPSLVIAPHWPAKVNNNGIPGGAVHEDQSSRTKSKTENGEAWV